MSEYYNWKEIVAKYDEEALAEIVRERGSEPADKVEAVLDELKTRGIEGEDDAAILWKIKERGMPDLKLPTLYSQKVIYVFSVLFSVFFGGVLFAMNVKEADRKKGILPVIIFTVFYAALYLYILHLVKIPMGGLIFGILYAYIINTVFWNTYIGKDVKFNKRSYRTPLIIALAITIPLLVLAVYVSLHHMPR